MPGRPQPPADIVQRVRRICAPLAGTTEHQAWTGTSWRVGGTTFAHVVEITDGWPPAYANAFRTVGPTTVVTFQADPDEYEVLGAIGLPFHRPPWRPGIVGVTIDDYTDWTDLAELLTTSHTICT